MRTPPNLLISFYLGCGSAVIFAHIVLTLQDSLHWHKLGAALTPVIALPGLLPMMAAGALQRFVCDREILTGAACSEDPLWAVLVISSVIFYGLLFTCITWYIERRKYRRQPQSTRP